MQTEGKHSMAMERLSNRRGEARPSRQLAITLAPRHVFHDCCNEILADAGATPGGFWAYLQDRKTGLTVVNVLVIRAEVQDELSPTG
jgi:hypothetical protein